jgi:hypothetical protein
MFLSYIGILRLHWFINCPYLNICLTSRGGGGGCQGLVVVRWSPAKPMNYTLRRYTKYYYTAIGIVEYNDMYYTINNKWRRNFYSKTKTTRVVLNSLCIL